MINLREIFNTNYNFIFISLTLIFFIILLLSTKDLKHIGKTLIISCMSLIVISYIIPIFINILNNNIIKIFLTPIINNIKTNIMLPSVVISIIGLILLIVSKKNKKLA